MKEASGELSMTAIAVVAIAAVGVIFTTLIFPNIKSSLTHNQKCSTAYGCHNCANGKCDCYVEGETSTYSCPDPNVNVNANNNNNNG